jgi:hypothetical protein
VLLLFGYFVLDGESLVSRGERGGQMFFEARGRVGGMYGCAHPYRAIDQLRNQPVFRNHGVDKSNTHGPT